jgi:hypothetical protein
MLTTDYMAGTGGGSTDMGNISYLTPSIHPMIAVAPHGVSLHTPEFADYATNEDATRAILDGAKIMAMTAIDLICGRTMLLLPKCVKHLAMVSCQKACFSRELAV